jgi:hypothetical protein
MWYSRALRREVEAIRAHGTDVLVMQPTRADLTVRAGNRGNHDDAHLRAIAQQARRSALVNLDRPAAARARALLAAAAYVPEHASR